MKSKNVDRDTAVNMSLNLPANLDAAIMAFKNKQLRPPLGDDFDLLAGAQGIERLPENYVEEKVTGEFYVPGQMGIVEVVEGIIKKKRSYKTK
jgi:hypothetical protein